MHSYFSVEPRHIVDCLKIIKDKSSEDKVYILDERLIIATRIITRCRVWNLRLNISTVPRREGRYPRPSYTVNIKTQSIKPTSQYQYSIKTRGLKPASQLHCNLKTQSMKPASGRVRNPRLARFRIGIQNTRLEARVLTTEKLRVSVITALNTGLITAHIMRELTPIMEGF